MKGIIKITPSPPRSAAASGASADQRRSTASSILIAVKTVQGVGHKVQQHAQVPHPVLWQPVP